MKVKISVVIILVLMVAGVFSAPVTGVQSGTTLSGILNIIFGDCEARGDSHVVYYLYTGPGEYVRIHPSTPVPLNYQGKQVAVTGVFNALSSGGIINATAVTLLDDTPVSPVVSGTRRIAMLLLKYSDSAAYTPNTATYYTNLMNPATNSVNGFYREESYNLLSIQADVYGWYTLPQPRSYYVAGGISSCGTANLGLIASHGVAVADPYVYFPTYNDVSFVMNDYLDCCAWGGGVTITADGQTKSYGATWEPPWAQNVGVYAHEIGHSIGCPHTGFVGGNTYDSVWDVESGGSSFNQVWRGSYYSVAAGGVTLNLYSADPCHHIAYHKINMGWIDKWHLETGTWTTTVTLNALAGTRTGFMGIKVYVRGENPAKKYFTVEARTRINYDQWLPADGVIIHFVDQDRMVPGAAGTDWVPAYPIDANPGTATLSDAQWGVGTTYTNAGYGLSISVLSKTGNSYQVRITGGWVSPTGLTDAAPAIVFFNSRLYAAVKGNGNNRIYLNSMNPSTFVWSGWSLLPAPSGATPSAPALAASSTYLYLVVRGMDNRIYSRRMTTGGSWSAWTAVPTGSTDAAPAATIFTFNGRLYCAVKGYGSNAIYLNSMDTGTLVWSGWVLRPGATPSSPALTSSSSYVYMAVRGTNNLIYWNRMTTGGSWSSWTAVPTGSTDSAPAITYFNNRLFAAVNGMGSNAIYINSMDSSLLSWPSWAQLTGASPSPHALAGSPTRIYISVRGTTNIIYYQ